MFFFHTSPNKSSTLAARYINPHVVNFLAQSFLLASFSRKLSSKTVDTIKGIIAEAIIDLSSKGNEEEESVTKFLENEVRVRRIRTPEIIVALT